MVSLLSAFGLFASPVPNKMFYVFFFSFMNDLINCIGHLFALQENVYMVEEAKSSKYLRRLNLLYLVCLNLFEIYTITQFSQSNRHMQIYNTLLVRVSVGCFTPY